MRLSDPDCTNLVTAQRQVTGGGWRYWRYLVELLWHCTGSGAATVQWCRRAGGDGGLGGIDIVLEVTIMKMLRIV